VKPTRRARRAVVFLREDYFQLSREEQQRECGRLWDALAAQLCPEAIQPAQPAGPEPCRRSLWRSWR
jgi:hypothetical protein